MAISQFAVRLQEAGVFENTKVYSMHAPGFSNRYYLLTSDESRPLLASPEVVGFEAYKAVLPATAAAFSFLHAHANLTDVDILTILRGGLNYPLEEACYQCGIRVGDMHFLSCERKIVDHVITGLDIKYEKVRAKKGRVLAIGDILATGDTFRYCLHHFIDQYFQNGGSLKRLVFITIGGSRAISIMEETAARLKRRNPDFEGVDCFFVEGMFTVYEDKGVSGINVPDIDFGWKGGVVAPEFRSYIIDHPDALLEKCIIYDGGARRYEIPVHFEEVLEYWEGIRSRAGSIDPKALVGEKLGYDEPLSFDDWKQVTCLDGLDEQTLRPLWKKETALLEAAPALDLKAVAERRIASVTTKKQQYE